MYPYDELRSKRAEISREWASRTCAAGSTFRIFAKRESPRIKEFLIREIGDGSKLARCGDASAYENALRSIIHKLRRRTKTNRKMKHRRPNFGQAAKVVNLYVKALLQLPDYLLPYNKRKLEEYAHVALDSQILGRMWGRKGKPGHFQKELISAGIKKRPVLSNLKDEHEYSKIQKVLADSCSTRAIPRIAYDYYWALREK